MANNAWMKHVVEVTWYDAISMRGWRDKATYAKQKAAPCRTVGYIIKKTKREMVLAQTQGGDEINGSMTIPRDWVQKIRKLS